MGVKPAYILFFLHTRAISFRCPYRFVYYLRISLKCPVLKPINLETMTYPFSRKGKFLSCLTVALSITAGTNAGPAPIFSQSSFPSCHISLKYSLYNNNEEAVYMVIPDTAGVKHTHTALSGYIRKDKNNDLVITVPDTQKIGRAHV